MRTPPQPSGLQMRPMRHEDIDEVMKIERLAHAFPWTEGNLRDCLKSGYSCQVGLQGGRLIGHAVMSVAAGEANILNLCIHPDRQGRGFGRRLLEQLLALARQQRADTVFLELRASNRAAARLYDVLGFHEIGMRHDYYPARKGREDAILMAKML